MRLHAQSGFSLLQISIVLTVGALILAAILPGGSAGGEMAKTRITLERMEKIEDAMQDFMSKNQRRPYPSDITADFSSAAFGSEISTPTDYSTVPTTHFTSSCIAVDFETTANDTTLAEGVTSPFTKNWLVSGTAIPNYSWLHGVTSASTLEMNKIATATDENLLYFRNPLVAGGIPVKSLGLPDEYAIDGFGRRMVYMVDSRVTTESGCMALQNIHDRGALQLSKSNNFSTGTYDQTMWALLSYGRDGQGAVGIQGTALANRIKTGNLDAATLVNAFYDSTQTTSFSNLGLVNKSATSTFDDIVWVNEPTKNTCAMGNRYSTRDFRINGKGVSSATTSATFGDINGDTFPDIVLGISQQSKLRVIFGKKDNWPEPNTAYAADAMDGNDGFTVSAGSLSSGLGAFTASGDFNGDGYDDILAGSSGGSTGYGIIFGGANWPANYVIGTNTTPASAVAISGLKSSVLSNAAIGDVNGDGYSDIALPFDLTGTGKWAMGVVYGKASGWGNFTLNTTFLNGTNGVYLSMPTPTYSSGDISFGKNTSDLSRQFTAICNVNGDAYGDLIFPGSWMSPNNTTPYPAVESSASNTTADAASSIVISTPSGTQESDLLLAVINKANSAADDIATPSGWTKYNTSLATNIRQVIYYKRATSSEPASVTFTPVATANMSGIILRISNAMVPDPVNIATSYSTSAATTFTAPSVTTTYNTTLVLYTLSSNSTQALTGTPALSTLVSNIASTGTDQNRQVIYSKTRASAGATGSGSYTVAGAANGTGFTLVLKGQPIERMYIKLGENRWAHSSGLIDPSTVPMLRLDTGYTIYELKGANCGDINSDGYDDILVYAKRYDISLEYIYVYFGSASPASLDIGSAYDIRFQLSTGSPSWKDSNSIPQLLLTDVNNDGRKDIVLSRGGDDPNVSVSGTTFTVNNNTSGTTRSNSGLSYVLYQPSTCTASTASTCWGTTPALAKTFFVDYTFNGTSGIKIVGATDSDGMLVQAGTDMNKDGKTDLILSTGLNPTGGYLLFGKTNWPSSYDLNCTRDKSGTHCPDQISAK